MSKSDYTQKVVNSISNTRLSPEEYNWVEKIEDVRNELESSSALVTFVDYGKRSPDSQLSADEMYRGHLVTTRLSELCHTSSMSRQWDTILFRLIRDLKPLRCLELGTCLGISTSYQASALLLNGCGQIITIEGAEQLACVASENLHKLGLDCVEIIVARFQDKLEEIIAHYQPLDFVFIDGHHDEQATLLYFETLLPRLSERAVLVFDDISWSPGMRRAWQKIRNHTLITSSIDLSAMGICTVEKPASSKVRA